MAKEQAMQAIRQFSDDSYAIANRVSFSFDHSKVLKNVNIFKFVFFFRLLAIPTLK